MAQPVHEVQREQRVRLVLWALLVRLAPWVQLARSVRQELGVPLVLQALWEARVTPDPKVRPAPRVTMA